MRTTGSNSNQLKTAKWGYFIVSTSTLCGIFDEKFEPFSELLFFRTVQDL